MTGHRCSNACARSHRLSRPQAAPFAESHWRDAAEALAGLAVLLLCFGAVWLWMAVAVAVQS